MLKYTIIFSALVFSGTFNVAANDSIQSPETIVRLIADEWCPFTCLETSENKGLIVDVAEAAFKEVGHEVTYEITSWARAIRQVQNGDVDALLGADSLKRKELLLADDFLIIDETVFVVLDGTLITIDTPDDLAKYRLGFMSGYSYGNSVDWNYSIETNHNGIALSGAYGETRLVELLATKRIDVAAMNIDVLRQHLAKNPEIPKVRFIRNGITTNLHIGFAPNPRGELLHTKFLEGYNILKISGQLKSIYAKYDIAMP